MFSFASTYGLLCRASGRRGLHASKAQRLQIKLLDNNIDDAHRVVLTDTVV